METLSASLLNFTRSRKVGTLADYPWIRKWDAFMGSCASYLKEQLALARSENAPENAIYKGDNGSWVTTDDVLDARTRFVLGLATSPAQGVPEV